MLQATLISKRLPYNPAAIPPPSSWPGCLGPPWRRKRPDGWTSTTQGKPESDCQTNAPKISAGTASCDHSTPGAIAGSDLQLPVKKTHLFSDADALLEAPQSSSLRSSGAHTYLASNRSLPCKRSATGDKSQDRTAPFGSQTPCSN